MHQYFICLNLEVIFFPKAFPLIFPMNLKFSWIDIHIDSANWHSVEEICDNH